MNARARKRVSSQKRNMRDGSNIGSYVAAYPGFTSTERKTIKKPFGNIFFTKDDTQGIPCLESAIWGGADAAQEIIRRLG